MKYFAIDEEQLKVLESVKSRLFTEMRMDGNQMRDVAQAIDALVRRVRDVGIPEDALGPAKGPSKPA